SSIANALARSSSVKGGKSFGNTNLLDTVAIPAFDPSSALHQRLAELSRRAHEIQERQRVSLETPGVPASKTLGISVALNDVEREINEAAAELWEISSEELEEIRKG
ncbi:MAG TPA: hypothetical protein VJ020_03380, partial [Anaerolineales bacterium]|nr:hypothetical protein [Anaerolineales bacterium]